MRERNDASTGQKAAYTVNEFCRMYSIGRTLFYAEIASGRLRSKKAGSKTLILAKDAEAWAHALPNGKAA